MSELDKLIEHFNGKKKEFSELELIRYVYIYLGKILTFDTDFLFGNTELKKQIYKKCSKDEKKLNEYLINKKIICKSIAYLIEYILKKLNINVESITDYYENVPYQHVSNMIFLKNGMTFSIDLQHDLENIQTNCRTCYFGPSLFSDEELEEIDLKIGYIKKEHYYTENYLYLLKIALTNNLSLKQKIKFILENIDVYNDISNMEYSERKNYYYHFIQMFIDKKEKNKLHFIDCCYIDGNSKKYKLCILVDTTNNEKVAYLYSNELRMFEEYNLEELNELKKQGFIFLGNIPGIKNDKQKTK